MKNVYINSYLSSTETGTISRAVFGERLDRAVLLCFSNAVGSWIVVYRERWGRRRLLIGSQQPLISRQVINDAPGESYPLNHRELRTPVKLSQSHMKHLDVGMRTRGV